MKNRPRVCPISIGLVMSRPLGVSVSFSESWLVFVFPLLMPLVSFSLRL